MQKVCLPAKIHFILHLIIMLWYYHHYRNDYKNNSEIFYYDLTLDIVLLLFFTWLLNYLCGINYKNTAWILLIFFIILGIVSVRIIKTDKLSYFETTAPLNM
jgi:hypothetical protein